MPFPTRSESYGLVVIAAWTDAADDAPNIEWARKFHAGMERWSAHLVYVNALDQDDQDRIAQAYGANHKRLCEPKTNYDPENLFRRNQNIRPQSEPAMTATA